MQRNYTYFFTNHARERFAERILQVGKKKVTKYVEQNVRKVDGLMSNQLKTAKAYSDPEMLELLSGDEQNNEASSILVSGKSIFVCKQNNGNQVIITCYDDKGEVGVALKDLIREKADVEFFLKYGHT
jgi:fructose-specific component phosphotransferase system IIB-like protein